MAPHRCACWPSTPSTTPSRTPSGWCPWRGLHCPTRRAGFPMSTRSSSGWGPDPSPGCGWGSQPQRRWATRWTSRCTGCRATMPWRGLVAASTARPGRCHRRPAARGVRIGVRLAGPAAARAARRVAGGAARAVAGGQRASGRSHRGGRGAGGGRSGPAGRGAAASAERRAGGVRGLALLTGAVPGPLRPLYLRRPTRRCRARAGRCSREATASEHRRPSGSRSGASTVRTGAEQSGTAMTLEALDWWDIPVLVELETMLFDGDSPWSGGDVLGGARRGQSLRRAPRRGRRDRRLRGRRRWPGTTRRCAPSACGRAGRVGGSVERCCGDLISAAGGRRILLEVRTDNEPAIALYESEGFGRLGLRRRYYQPSGADAFTMARRPEGGGVTEIVTLPSRFRRARHRDVLRRNGCRPGPDHRRRARAARARPGVEPGPARAVRRRRAGDRVAARTSSR